MEQKKIAYQKQIPVRYKADIAVLGGGIAGLSAACAAAKRGKKVIIIEKMNCLGGNSTSGGVASFCGETRGQGEVFDEIILRLEEFGAIAEYQPYPEYSENFILSDKHEELFEQTKPRIFDFQYLISVFDQMASDYGIQSLFHTRVVDAIVREGTVRQVLLAGQSGLEACEADIFIDCTGEADAVFHAGFETMKGREHDNIQLPMSLMFFIRHISDVNQLKHIPERYVERIERKEDLPMNTIWPNGPSSNAVKVKIHGFDSTDSVSLTMAEQTGRKKMLQVLDYYQRVENRKWYFDHVSPIIGIREGRRVVGEYILTVSDIQAGRKFPDAIAKGVYFIDALSPLSDKREMIMKIEDSMVPPYQIPYRCLLVKDSVNMLAAGRCFSADQLAMSSARVFTTSSMTGQAAGIAAALALDKESSLRKVNVDQLQREIMKGKGQL